MNLGLLDSGYYLAPEAQWEFGSSPIIHEGRVIVQVDVQKGSFLGAFDVKTGKELWRTARHDVPTWSTPTIHEVGGRTQVWSTAGATSGPTTSTRARNSGASRASAATSRCRHRWWDTAWSISPAPTDRGRRFSLFAIPPGAM